MIMQPIQINLTSDIPVACEFGFSNPAGDSSFSDIMRDTVQSGENQFNTRQDSVYSSQESVQNYDTPQDQLNSSINSVIFPGSKPKFSSKAAY